MFNFLLLLSACQDYDINPKDGGFYDDSPTIEVSPESIHFDYLNAGESAVETITIKSVGEVTLKVMDISLREGGTFQLSEIETGDILVGEQTDFVLTWISNGDYAEDAVLIKSNDPINDVVSVPINTGILPVDTADTSTDSGIVVNEPEEHKPTAVCSVDPDEVEAIHESAAWIGELSFDEDGEPITQYTWTLYSSPAGSVQTMPAGAANRIGFTPDMVGEYVGELIVENSIGEVSEPCYTTLEAYAGGDLWIEMFWTHSGDDMDLHLLKPGGSLTTNGDCYYGNCTYGGLDWGTVGDPTDNPVLDIDDIAGVGPENINIDSPYDGTYSVYVHDYPGSVYNGRNDVTVNVYVGGMLEWTDTANINSEGLYEPICDIDWAGSSATVTGI